MRIADWIENDTKKKRETEIINCTVCQGFVLLSVNEYMSEKYIKSVIAFIRC